MIKKTLIWIAAVLAGWQAAGAADGPLLTLYLPRNVTVQTPRLNLGTISVIRAQDESLKNKAAAIPMGRAPFSRETLVIGRPVIVGRLAANGFQTNQIQITGAQKVSVSLGETIVKADRIVAVAEEFLKLHSPGSAGVRWRATGAPADLAIPSAREFKLQARMGDATESHVKVLVAAIEDEQELGTRVVLFNLSYPQREAVAVNPIAEGEMISPANTRIRTVMGARQQDRWQSPFGMVAARPIHANSMIQPTMVQPVRPAVAVQRQDKVLMIVTGTCFTVTALGEALEDGRPGDFIRVRNVDSRRIITAKVTPEGNVEPVFVSKEPNK